MKNQPCYELRQQRLLQRAYDDVVCYLQDFSTIEQWDPGVYRAKKLTPGQIRLGTEYALQLNVAGKSVPMTYTVQSITLDDNGFLLTLNGQGERFSAFDEIRVTRVADDQTHIDYRANITLAAVPQWLAPLLKGRLQKLGAKALDGLVHALSDPETVPLSLKQKVANALILPSAARFTRRGYYKMAHKGLSQRLAGQTWVVTGPTAGIGLAVASELARLGANLILVGRGSERLVAAASAIRDFCATPPPLIKTVQADLSTLAGMRAAVEHIHQCNMPIAGLINNAGALFDQRMLTEDGIEQAMAINLVAPYVLTQGLIPHLQQTAGRVINVASGGMYLQALAVDDMNSTTDTYDGTKAYARAKRALVWLTAQWAKQHPHIGFAAMHPGWVSTPGLAKSLPAFQRKMQRQLRDPRMGADTIVWLASTRQSLNNGAFWFDRQCHPTAVLPGTAVTVEQGDALMAWLNEIVA